MGIAQRPVSSCIALASLLAGLGLSVTAVAQTKSFIDYIKPTPITCAPLSSASWGVAGVLPRDLCNGIESAKGEAVPPEFYYWDGQILKAKDGKYHMFMSTWSGTAGFNPGWTGSDAYHAISEQGVLGPYQRQDYVYTNNGSHKGHNVSALELPDGSYAVVVSETVAFTIYKSSSLDGPWTGCVAQIQPNGIKTSSDVACPPGGACNDTHWDSNVSLVARDDGRFQIVQRHGFIAIADTLCGPYKMQKPTWTYPQANLPNVDSIYPKRTSIPGVSNPTYGWEEDPHIWYSGGTYHVLYSGSGDRVGWHLYSTDGITEWKDGGLAYSPREYQKIFCYEGSTTCTAWYKCERPGVFLEGGHPTHITLAVADVDKDNQIPAGSNHGSKVVVLPFDGVAFDADYGNGEPATGGSTGTGGATGTGGVDTGGGVGTGGVGGLGGATATTGGRTGRGGATTGGGNGGSVTGGRSSSSGGSPSGGTTSVLTGGSPSGGTTSVLTGGSPSGGTTSVLTGGGGVGGSSASSAGGSGGSVSPASGGASTSGGTAASTGGSSSSVPSSGGSGVGGSTTTVEEQSSSGCGCILGSTSRGGVLGHSLLLGALGILAARRRNRRERHPSRERV
jgi:hypothetical protein